MIDSWAREQLSKGLGGQQQGLGQQGLGQQGLGQQGLGQQGLGGLDARYIQQQQEVLICESFVRQHASLLLHNTPSPTPTPTRTPYLFTPL